MSIDVNGPQVLHNAPVAQLYEIAIREEGCRLTDTGALVAYSGAKTGRSPRDKRVVLEPETQAIWWGPVNIPLQRELFAHYSAAADAWLHSQATPRLFIVDAYCGWDPAYRVRVRLYCASAYHALFMRNMLIPAEQPFDSSCPPQFTIRNVGQLALSAASPPAGLESDASLKDTLVALCFSTMEMVIYGTLYAGEMKKGILTLMMYLMPLQHQLCLHSSANIDAENNLTVFFGLSGTGKTTLSADPRRQLIGDDEHVWTDSGVFNVEGGCYAKCIDLSAAKEPDIYAALRFGAVLENVVLQGSQPDYSDDSITENTRAAYPLQYIANALLPATVARHPNHIVFLTCDTFGLLPPISRLSIDQAIEFFVAGYTSKVAGTEVGISAAVAVFSACFGEPFLVWQPLRYGELLRERLEKHGSTVWLLNTGWTEGAYGVGHRISISDSRRLLDAVHSGELGQGQFVNFPVFNFEIPTACSGISNERTLDPRRVWPAGEPDYLQRLGELKKQFDLNLAIKTGAAEAPSGSITMG